MPRTAASRETESRERDATEYRHVLLLGPLVHTVQQLQQHLAGHRTRAESRSNSSFTTPKLNLHRPRRHLVLRVALAAMVVVVVAAWVAAAEGMDSAGEVAAAMVVAEEMAAAAAMVAQETEVGMVAVGAVTMMAAW